MRIFLKTLIASILITGSLFSASKPISILFLGSELISKNNLPEVVKFLIENTTDKRTEVDLYICSFSGFRMQWIEAFDMAVNRIGLGKYKGIRNCKKYAILQERPEALLNPHIKAIQPLENVVLALTQNQTDPYVLNSTPFVFCPYLSKDKADQQETLNEKLQKLANERKVALLPVAQIWREVEAKNDRIYLYHANDEFPSQHGTYLTACVILETVFKINCVGLPTTFEVPDMPIPIKFQLNPEHCQTIQSTVHEYVQNFTKKNS